MSSINIRPQEIPSKGLRVPGPRSRKKRSVLVILCTGLVTLIAIPVIGLTFAAMTTSDGIEGFGEEPIEHYVAERAYSMAWNTRDNPIQRILSPAARVVLVKRMPGHCTSPKNSSWSPRSAADSSMRWALERAPEPPFEDTDREYISQVRFFTFFGYPAGDIYVTCGGDSGSVFQPSWWP